MTYVELASGQHTDLTPQIHWDVEAFDLSPDGRRIAFVTNDEGVSVLPLLDTSTCKEVPVSWGETSRRCPRSSGWRSCIPIRCDVRERIERIASDRPTYANRVFELVRRVFSWAVEKDVLETSPCIGLRKPAPDGKRDRVLSAGELRRVTC